MTTLENNIGLKYYIQNYPHKWHPTDVSEDGARSMHTLYLKSGSGIADFISLGHRIGLRAIPGEEIPKFGTPTEYRYTNEIRGRAGGSLQVFAQRQENTIQLTMYGLEDDILSLIDRTEEGELVSDMELMLGPMTYHCLKGSALGESQHLDEAIAEFEQGLKSERPAPYNPDVERAFKRMEANLHYNLGEAFAKKGNSTRALKEFRACLKHDSKSEVAWEARQRMDELHGQH